jgi:hypothetical protein
MSEDLEALPERERARVNARDRKQRGPKVVVDNPGLRQVAMQRAARLREQRKPRPRPATDA